MHIITRILHTKYDISRTQGVKKLLRCHCSYHGNLVTIAARYDANAYCPKEGLC